MPQENNFDADSLIQAIEQKQIKFFLESQSVELELKVTIHKETDDPKVYTLGSFEGAGLNGLHTLKVKIGDVSGKPAPKPHPSPPSDSDGGPGDPP